MNRTSIHTIAAAILMAVAAPSALAQAAQEIRIVLPEQPANLEPCGTIITNVGQILSQNVVEPLTVIDPVTGQPQPKLATEWTSVDPTTWRIKLREGVKFQDGSELNAEAVAFSIDRMIGGEITSGHMAEISDDKLAVTPVV